MLDELYQELILQHAKQSARRGALDGSSVLCSNVHNPLCGDELVLSAEFDGDVLKAIRFDGEGCAISQASASMLAELAEGKTRQELETAISSFRAMIHGEIPLNDCKELGDLLALEGVKKFPVRVKCAMLAFEALSKLLSQSSPERHA
ncbi:MAG: SUF system NifU family Fe-S cluster assembly protein [Bdellovibrionales bacterium]|nr:SUF system NifU family Fe-S cluster assembly protein [Bdellovibrionales bacterium]